MREAVQGNPAMLQPLIEQIGASSPQLLEQINANPSAFLALLNAPAGEGALMDALGGDDMYDEGEGGEEVARIEITAEDDAAIGRLQELGASRDQAAEAYLSCDRNEQLAANMLLNDMFGN